MFQDFDLVVLDEVVLVAQRYRQDVLAAGHDDDFTAAIHFIQVFLPQSHGTGQTCPDICL
jgi:hypothetical protein